MAENLGTSQVLDGAPNPNEGAQPDLAAAVAEAIKAQEPDDDTPPVEKPPEPEKPAEPPKPEEPKQPTESERVRAILKGAARREKQALDAQRAAKQVEQKAQAFDEFARLLPTDPTAAFQRLGLDPLAVLDRVIKKGEQQTPTTEAEIAALKQWRAEREQAEQQARLQASIDHHMSEVKQMVVGAGDRFELINTEDAHDLVWDTMSSYYKQTGEVPDPLEVADQVEAHLAERAEKALATKKFSARVKAQTSQATPRQPIPGETSLAGNNPTPSPASDDDFPLDPHERTRAVLRSLGMSG